MLYGWIGNFERPGRIEEMRRVRTSGSFGVRACVVAWCLPYEDLQAAEKRGERTEIEIRDSGQAK